MLDFTEKIEENKLATHTNEQHSFTEKEQGVSFSTHGLAANQTFNLLRDKNPTKYRMIQDDLLDEKLNIDTRLQFMSIERADASQLTNAKQIREMKHRLWVIEGVLNHNLDIKLLEQIAEKHSRIGTLPSGYFYPELYLSRNK